MRIRAALGIRSATVVAMWAGAVLLAAPGVADAACAAAQRADTVAASGVVAALPAGHPATVDAAAVLQRSRTRCTASRFAHAIAIAARASGAPAVGRRVRVVGVDLIATQGRGVVVWRLDVVRIAGRIAATRSARSAGVLRQQLASAATGSGAVTWSDDPTRAGWDPGRQSAVVAALDRSIRFGDRLLAQAGVRAFAAPRRLSALRSLPILEHLRIANRVAAVSSKSTVTSARLAARAVGMRALARVRAARARGWSRVGGRWSNLATHRALVAQAGALVTRIPHTASADAVAGLQRTLVVAPDVDFGALPTAPFYPWPRDGAFDDQSVTIVVDKPSTVRMTIYAPDEHVVRTVDAILEPGPGTLAWDGAASDGTIQGAEDYRYNVDATDLAGNRIRVPGLEQFRIARDAAPPTVRGVSVRHSNIGGVRRVVAGWDVTEVESPLVRTWLLLQRGGDRRSLQLHGSLRRATVRRAITLPPGTWTATFVFFDGSGNRVKHRAPSVVVR